MTIGKKQIGGAHVTKPEIVAVLNVFHIDVGHLRGVFSCAAVEHFANCNDRG
jgi:hypothetical protein